MWWRCLWVIPDKIKFNIDTVRRASKKSEYDNQKYINRYSKFECLIFMTKFNKIFKWSFKSLDDTILFWWKQTHIWAVIFDYAWWPLYDYWTNTQNGCGVRGYKPDTRFVWTYYYIILYLNWTKSNIVITGKHFPRLRNKTAKKKFSRLIYFLAFKVTFTYLKPRQIPANLPELLYGGSILF